jgi:hypothetical protein
LPSKAAPQPEELLKTQRDFSKHKSKLLHHNRPKPEGPKHKFAGWWSISHLDGARAGDSNGLAELSG